MVLKRRGADACARGSRAATRRHSHEIWKNADAMILQGSLGLRGQKQFAVHDMCVYRLCRYIIYIYIYIQTHVCIFIYIYTIMCVYIYRERERERARSIYIYTYLEREREGERETEREREKERHVYIYIYICLCRTQMDDKRARYTLGIVANKITKPTFKHVLTIIL